MVGRLICTSLLSFSLYPATSASPTFFTPSLGRSPRIEIHVIQKQPVDKYHPTVQQLIEAGYDVEQSIEAVEHRENLEGAMDYLLNLEGEGELFHKSTEDEGHQYSEEMEIELVEESQKERAM